MCGLQPKVFVAENVSGLVKGTAKGYFKMIPQGVTRLQLHGRIALLGRPMAGRAPDAPAGDLRRRAQRPGGAVRRQAAFPVSLPYYYSVREAVPWIVAIRIGGQRRENRQPAAIRPAGTVVQSDGRRTNTTAYMASYLDELAAFPNGKYRDQVDASSGELSQPANVDRASMSKAL